MLIIITRNSLFKHEGGKDLISLKHIFHPFVLFPPVFTKEMLEKES